MTLNFIERPVTLEKLLQIRDFILEVPGELQDPWSYF